MARVTLHIPTPLRSHAGDRAEMLLEAETVGDLLDQVARDHDPLVQRIRARDGTLRPYVNIFVRRTDVRSLEGLETPLQEGDEVIIMPSVAGGRD